MNSIFGMSINPCEEEFCYYVSLLYGRDVRGVKSRPKKLSAYYLATISELNNNREISIDAEI